MYKYKIYSDEEVMTHDITLSLITFGFSGYTIYNTTGVWKDKFGQLKAVPAWVIEAITDKAIPISQLNEVLGEIGVRHEQEAVLFTIEPIDAHFLETGGSNG